MTPPRTASAIRVAAVQIIGRREGQEDAFGISRGLDRNLDLEKGAVAVLADGMGGHKGGATASRMAVEVFLQAMSTGDPGALTRALDLANSAIGEKAAGNSELEGMGCTLVGLAFHAGGLSYVSVGDSPMWRLRAGLLERINADHSVGGLLARRVDDGEISAAEASAHPSRNALLSAVVGKPLELIDSSSAPLALFAGDRFLLASDGILALSEAEISEILSGTSGPDMAAQRLIRAVEAKNDPRQDNTTVLVIDAVGDDDASPTLVWAPDPAEAGPSRGRLAGLIVLALVLGFVLAWLVFHWITPQTQTAPPVPQEMPPETPQETPSEGALPGASAPADTGDAAGDATGDAAGGGTGNDTGSETGGDTLSAPESELNTSKPVAEDPEQGPEQEPDLTPQQDNSDEGVLSQTPGDSEAASPEPEPNSDLNTPPYTGGSSPIPSPEKAPQPEKAPPAIEPDPEAGPDAGQAPSGTDVGDPAAPLNLVPPPDDSAPPSASPAAPEAPAAPEPPVTKPETPTAPQET